MALPSKSFVLCFDGANKPIADHFDVIELNHFWDEFGNEPIFSQIIFWRWQAIEGHWGYRVGDWRLVKDKAQIPVLRGTEFVATWRDFKDKDVMRRTSGRIYRITNTLYDPELADRNKLPESKRIGLTPKR